MQPSTIVTEPYAWEPSSRQIALENGLQEEKVIRFDMNTTPYILDTVRQRLDQCRELRVNEYPAPDYASLRESVSGYCNTSEEQVVLCAGADEVIDTIAKTFLQGGRRSVISEPTYSMFRVVSQAYGAPIVGVPRTSGFALDVDALADAARDAAVAWVCNPNSPTGNVEPVKKIRELLEKTDCAVVVDEAYAEFCGQSALALVDRFDRLIVVRTLSKAFGLAGARVGYAVTNEAVAQRLNAVRLPNSISSLSSELAQAALSPEGIRQMRANVARIADERLRMKKALEKKIKAYPSVANFLLVDVGDAAGKTVKSLQKKGLVVRDLSQKPLTPGCIRITIRSAEENNRLLEALG